MNTEKFTTGQLADRWMDRRELQNLMGRFVTYGLLKRENRIYDDFWCRGSSGPVLGVNNGYYVGGDAVRGYYEAKYKNTDAVSELIREMYPDYLGRLSRQELHGVGTLEVDALTTCVIELAGDSKTAKGLWYAMGVDNGITPGGPCSTWGYGYAAADFIREDGQWKIWHLLSIDDIASPVGENWSQSGPGPEPLPGFEAVGRLSLPRPTVERTIREKYYPGREFSPLVRIPEPYEAFSETFSYGI